MANSTGKVVQTERIEVVDNEGRVRIVLGWLGESDNGVYGVVIRDEQGRYRAWITHDGPAAEVGLDHNGSTVAALSVGDDGRARSFFGE